MLAPYLRRDAQEAYVVGNGRCNLAAEDRDLLAEAKDEDACIGAALEVTALLYRPVHLGPGARILPITN